MINSNNGTRTHTHTQYPQILNYKGTNKKKTLTSSSVIKMLGSGDCVIPKLAANCLATACDTSRPATFENLFNTVLAEPLLFSAITDDNDAHSEYISTMCR